MPSTRSRHPRVVLLAIAAAGIVAGACHPPRAIARTGGRELLRASDVPDRYRTHTVLEMLRDIRPEYLQNRAHSTRVLAPTAPVVYLNGHRLMDLDMLRHVSTRSLVEIRYVRGVNAVARYGLDHESGVLLVTARTGP